MAVETQPTPVQQLLDPNAIPKYDFAFDDFLQKEYGFDVNVGSRELCKDFIRGNCPNGDQCPRRHFYQSNYSNLVCKHWLRGLCKKGDTCEFLHEYNLRLMPECTQFSKHDTCTNGADCLYLHVDPEFKKPPCPHYEQGFCPLGPYCAARHVKRKAICKYYLAGFCPNGRDCDLGAHPAWRDRSELPKPEVKKILSEEEKEAERQRLLEKLEQEREDEEKRFQGRDGDTERRGQSGRGGGRRRWQNRQRRDRH